MEHWGNKWLTYSFYMLFQQYVPRKQWMIALLRNKGYCLTTAKHHACILSRCMLRFSCFLVRACRPTSQLLQRSAHLYYTAPLRGDSFSLQASQGINNSSKCLHSYSGILNYSPVLKWLKGKMEIAISTWRRRNSKYKVLKLKKIWNFWEQRLSVLRKAPRKWKNKKKA